MADKAEGFYSDNHFYIFVNLNGLNGSPEYFIVPSKTVANFVATGHATWLATPGKKGQVRQDSTMRKFTDINGEFLGRWDLLGL